MKDDVRQTQKSQLAVAIAQGESITAWALKNQVPSRTAFRWASDPKVRRLVEAWRRRALNRAIGRMARLSLKAANAIAKLGDERRVRVGSAQGVAGHPGRPDGRLQVLGSRVPHDGDRGADS